MSRTGCLLIALLGAPIFAADKPTPQQIEGAIKDLGAKNFGAREKAAKLLWEAGAGAEEALRVAANSPDAETARRARTILDKFDWGIFPDTPEPVVEQITNFRNGDRNARIQCVTKLMALGKPGYAALKRVAEMEPDANNKQALFAQMAQEAQRVLPGLLAAGDTPAVEDMLDRCLLAGSEDNFTSYAAFQALTGKLPQSLARWEQDYAKSKSVTAGTVIVHLLRAMGKFEPAREWAKKLKNDSLVEQLLWEEGNWKELSERLKNSPTETGDVTGVGLRAAVHRLAGDKTAFDLAIAKLVKVLEGTDRYQVRSAAEALLLNGRPDDALLAHAKVPSLAFDVLFTQMRYKEALALAEAAKIEEREERFRLGVRHAHALYVLGKREAALAKFTELGAGLKEASELTWARELVRTMAKLNLREEAALQAARYLDFLRRQDVRDGWDEVLAPIFDNDGDIAATWWRFLRGKHGDDAAAAMKAVLHVLDGPPPGKLAEWCEDLAQVSPVREELPATTGETRSFTWPAFAAATALARAGQAAKADELMEKVMAQQPDASVPLRYADGLAHRGKTKAAAEWYGRAAKIAPAYALPVFLRGQSLGGTEGTALIELAHRMPLGSELDRGKFAGDLDARGFYADARKECDLVLSFGWHRYGHVGLALNLAARHARMAGDYPRAEALLERFNIGMLRFGLSFVDRLNYLILPQTPHVYRMHSLLAAKSYDDALAEAKAVLAVLPGEIGVVTAAVTALDRAGRKPDADALYGSMRQRFEDHSKDYPASAMLHNNIAWLSATCGRDLDAALADAQAAVAAEPRTATYLDTVAELHFRRGDNAKAAELARKCLAMQPGRKYYTAQLARFEKGDRNAPVPQED